MEQREVDNMLLSMIQKHFPSLPLSDEYTDWGKWLGFARAVYESGRASPASAPEGYVVVPVEPTLEMFNAGGDAFFTAYTGTATSSPDRVYKAMIAAAPTPPVSEDRKDAERFRDGWTHSCNALCIDGLELWIERCPHCGMPAPKAPAMQEDKKP